MYNLYKLYITNWCDWTHNSAQGNYVKKRERERERHTHTHTKTSHTHQAQQWYPVMGSWQRTVYQWWCWWWRWWMVVVTADHVLSPGTLHQYPAERNDTQWSPTGKTEGIKIRIRRRSRRRRRRRKKRRRRKESHNQHLSFGHTCRSFGKNKSKQTCPCKVHVQFTCTLQIHNSLCVSFSHKGHKVFMRWSRETAHHLCVPVFKATIHLHVSVN